MRNRPGAPVSRDHSGKPPEVVDLVVALQELIDEAGTNRSEVAGGLPGKHSKQSVSRSLNSLKGPDRQLVLGIVRFCSERLGEPADSRVEVFARLWEAANPTRSAQVVLRPSGENQPETPEPVDLSMVALVLGLVVEGARHEAAVQLVSTYPQGGAMLGQILAEVGRRLPGGVVDILDAVAEEAGTPLANTYLDSLRNAEADVAATVDAVPRTRPAPPEPPATAEPLNIVDQDPEDLQGRRHALLLRNNEVAQVVAEILAEVTPTRLAAGSREFFDIDAVRRFRRGLDTERAFRLIKAICDHDPDDTRLLAVLLPNLIAEGHPRLVLQFLYAVHQMPDEGPRLAHDTLAAMPRPELISALDQLATGEIDDIGPDTLDVLLGDAPGPVTREILLRHAETGKRAPVDLAALPHLNVVLRAMIERDCPTTALVLAREIDTWDVESAVRLPADRPETRIASVLLDLARDDVEGPGRLLYFLLAQSAEDAARLLFLLEMRTGDADRLPLVAKIVTAAIRRDPQRAVILLAINARQHGTPIRLLERAVQENTEYTRLLATAMLTTDHLPYFRELLPDFIRQEALALTVELLRQLADRDSGGPWDLVGHALKDGNSSAALDILEPYLAGM
jgi:hypothetical protein